MDAARRGVVASATIALALALMVLNVASAASFGVSYPDHVSIAAGVRADVVALLAPPVSSWSVEASDREMFDSVGLRVTGLRGALQRDTWRVELETASMSAAVGEERLVGARIARMTESWSVAAGVAHEAVDIAGAVPAWLTTLELRTGVSLQERVFIRCEADGFRVAGMAHPGADIETSVTVIAVEGAAVTSALVVDRAVGAHARVSAAMCILERAVVVAGYDDESATLALAIAVVAGGARGIAGASVHPVLGLSRGVSVGWGR